jgi:hypothetical protein
MKLNASDFWRFFSLNKGIRSDFVRWNPFGECFLGHIGNIIDVCSMEAKSEGAWVAQMVNWAVKQERP